MYINFFGAAQPRSSPVTRRPALNGARANVSAIRSRITSSVVIKAIVDEAVPSSDFPPGEKKFARKRHGNRRACGGRFSIPLNGGTVGMGRRGLGKKVDSCRYVSSRLNRRRWRMVEGRVK